MIGEVIAIGDEMTTGARVDTNSAWLSQQLASVGVRTFFQTTVADDIEAGVQAFRIAAQRADIVIATGGLGPTRDDLTREVLAMLMNQPLEFRPEVMEHIQTLFSRRGREMPERNRLQAMFPLGADVVPNPQGTAPGLDLTFPREGLPPSRIFALPGVPAEMKQMVQATVIPRLVASGLAGQRVMRQQVVKCFGVGESEMESRLGNMIARDRTPSVGITVSRATISLRITADATDNTQALQQIEETRQQIYQMVPEFIFGEGEGCELQDAVSDALADRAQSLAVIEAGAAAPLAGWLAGKPGFRAGMYVPELSDLEKRKGEPQEEIFARIASESKVDWLLAVDAYPQLPETDQPLPAFPLRVLVWKAIASSESKGELQVSELELGGHPDIVQDRIAKAALDILRKQLVRKTKDN